MSIKQHELYKNSVANLNAAMDKIKFHGLKHDDAETIRGHICEARGSITALSGVETDPMYSAQLCIEPNGYGLQGMKPVIFKAIFVD